MNNWGTFISRCRAHSKYTWNMYLQQSKCTYLDMYFSGFITQRHDSLFFVLLNPCSLAVWPWISYWIFRRLSSFSKKKTKEMERHLCNGSMWEFDPCCCRYGTCLRVINWQLDRNAKSQTPSQAWTQSAF